MTDQDQTPEPSEPHDVLPDDGRRFRVWRLLGVIFVVVVIIAGVSAVVDLMAIGPLERR